MNTQRIIVKKDVLDELLIGTQLMSDKPKPVWEMPWMARGYSDEPVSPTYDSGIILSPRQHDTPARLPWDIPDKKPYSSTYIMSDQPKPVWEMPCMASGHSDEPVFPTYDSGIILSQRQHDRPARFPWDIPDKKPYSSTYLMSDQPKPVWEMPWMASGYSDEPVSPTYDSGIILSQRQHDRPARFPWDTPDKKPYSSPSTITAVDSMVLSQGCEPSVRKVKGLMVVADPESVKRQRRKAVLEEKQRAAALEMRTHVVGPVYTQFSTPLPLVKHTPTYKDPLPRNVSSTEMKAIADLLTRKSPVQIKHTEDVEVSFAKVHPIINASGENDKSKKDLAKIAAMFCVETQEQAMVKRLKKQKINHDENIGDVGDVKDDTTIVNVINDELPTAAISPTEMRAIADRFTRKSPVQIKHTEDVEVTFAKVHPLINASVEKQKCKKDLATISAMFCVETQEQAMKRRLKNQKINDDEIIGHVGDVKDDIIIFDVINNGNENIVDEKERIDDNDGEIIKEKKQKKKRNVFVRFYRYMKRKFTRK